MATRRPSSHNTARVAVVTGGAGGIGLACVNALAAQGYRAVILDLAADRPRDKRIAAYGCDVTSAIDVRRTVARILADWKRIDVVVNAAGIVEETLLAQASDVGIDRLIDVNLKGTINVVRACLPALVKASGLIVNISSAQAHRPSPGLAIYAATKGAIESFTKALAVELAPRVRANAISPGLIRTSILLNQKGVTPKTYDAYVKRRARGYLLKRIGEPAEIAAMVVYLASDKGSWITGAIVPVDGGKSVGGG
ncbi:MAG: SDR family oxidoreductase [Alphaproteobacteria bacterium]|nr:SDR family oxidoreductase [Alphaproteobacteria bacterium]